MRSRIGQNFEANMNAESIQKSPKFRGFVANFLIGGGRVVRNGETFSHAPLEIDCGGFRFEFYQHSELADHNADPLNDEFIPSTEVLVNGIQENQVAKIREVLERICWLLSFVVGCRVVCYGYEYPSGTGHRHVFSFTASCQYFRPVIDFRNGTAVKQFIEQVYSSYSQLEKSRRLNYVVDYLIQADKAAQPIEVGLILVFVAIESLKDTFARSQSIPFRKGFFRKPPKVPGRDGGTYTFEELLTLMFRGVRMRKGLKRLIKLRNNLIHSGLSRTTHKRQMALYDDCHDLIREYLLRLLGYRGTYTPYAIKRRGAVVEIR